MTDLTDADRAALEPCPFCGGAAAHVAAAQPTAARYVFCVRCNNGTAMTDTREQAAALWNRRVAGKRAAAVPPREPTEEMIDAAYEAGLRGVDDTDDDGSETSARSIWRAMYDAAPAERPTDETPVARDRIQPTYYVRHPDDSYSIAKPQPVMPIESTDEATALLRMLTADYERWLADGVIVALPGTRSRKALDAARAYLAKQPKEAA